MKKIIRVEQLIEALMQQDMNAEVYVGAQGVSNYDADAEDYRSDSVGVVVVKANNGGIIIRDPSNMVEGEE